MLELTFAVTEPSGREHRLPAIELLAIDMTKKINLATQGRQLRADGAGIGFWTIES